MRTTARSLGDVLFGQTRGGILALLYGQPDESFYVRQIARTLGTSVGAVQRELQNLEHVGLVDHARVGRQVFYRGSQDNPVFHDLRALLAKTKGVFHLLRSALEPLAKRIRIAFVYGSIAREEEKAGSDVDLMIIGQVSLDDVLGALASIEASVGRAMNPTVYSISEFRSKLAGGNHFLRSVIGGKKVFLFGDEDELRKMGGVRLAKAGTNKS